MPYIFFPDILTSDKGTSQKFDIVFMQYAQKEGSRKNGSPDTNCRGEIYPSRSPEATW